MDIEQFKATLRALPEDVKWKIKWELDQALDSMPLVTISRREIVETMEEEGYSHPDLNRWAHDAAYRVYSKHPGDDEMRSYAVDWGRSLVIDYAKSDGVTLEPKEEEEVAA